MRIGRSRSPSEHAARWVHDGLGPIQVRGARENNLRDVSLDIPKRKLTVFTGVSGSGKSSLVFETIAAESERLINETYPAFVQGFMGTPPRPEVDSLDNLTAAIIVDQERMGANARSTVGTATDAHAMLRIVFSRLGQPHVGPASAFSFNMPAGTVSGEMVLERGSGGQREEVVERISGGMCAECEGLGRVSTVDVDALVDRDKSLNEGAITFPGFQPGTWYHRIFADSGFFDPDKPVRDFTDAELERLLYGPETKVKTGNINLTYLGLVDKIRRAYLVKDLDALQPAVRRAVERISTSDACPSCGGTRLNALARSSLIDGRNIADLAAMQISDLADFLRGIDDAGCPPDPRGAPGPPRLDGPHRPRLPEPRSRVVDAVRRRGAADEDGPPPWLVPDRCDLRLRRADDRPPRPRRGADERAAAAPPRQGQHRPRRRARSGGHARRRSRRRHGARVPGPTAARSSTRVRTPASRRRARSPASTSRSSRS